MINLESLEDDNFEEFKGGTLQINQDSSRLSCDNSPEPINSTESRDNETNANIDNKISNLISIPKRITETLWNCRNNNNNNAMLTTAEGSSLSGDDAQDYFTFRDGVVDAAVKDCERLVQPNEDGDVIGTFLLTEITMWDTEKERLIILTNKSVYSIKYDFIAMKQLEYRRILLSTLDSIVVGDLVYPPASLVPDRKSRGVRLLWNKGALLAFTQRWNPFSNDVPYVTFTSHPLYGHPENLNDNQREIFSMDVFSEKLADAVEQLNITGETRESPCLVHHKEIVLPTYLGLGSFIYNRNSLGFFKVRGKFSF